MCEKIIEFLTNHESLTGAILGALISLCGTIIVLKYELKKQEAERMEKIKPILINYKCANGQERESLPKYVFSSENIGDNNMLSGVFKNTDNGIVFIDKICSKDKIFIPQYNYTIDKNTVFSIELRNIHGTNINECKLLCHDVLGNNYYYNMILASNYNCKDKLTMGNIHKGGK